jgi:branched-chain amino acid transport system ATP-binding protein
MLLKYMNVEVLYNNIILALKGVTLEVAEGSIVSILGANGAGKSTILRSISGLLSLEGGRISSGEIYFEGKRIDGMEPSQVARSRISMVVEGRGLFRSLSVEENLKVGTLMRKDGKKKIREDLDVVFQIFPVLKERRMQISGTMSGGEQQMLCIAMGMMTKPKLLLLDEPSLGLAPIVSEQVFEAVKRINVELGTTILLVEQNAFLSLAISDFAYVITIGKVAVKARAEELVGKDISRYYLGMGAGNAL